MPTIKPSMVPTKAPGTLFSSLTGGDDTLNIRWLMAADPAFYEVFNRPLADLTVRQLVIAKAVDSLQIRLGHQAFFPFVVQPRIIAGTEEIDVPLGWIWDFHASLPKKWENLRLAKIKRMSGENDTTAGFTGWLRLIFTASTQDSTTEVAIFQADYQINSALTYQPVRLQAVESPAELVVINAGEVQTVAGFMIFRTLDTTLDEVQAFLDLMTPPTDRTDSDGDNFYDNPAIYELADTNPGGTNVTDDFQLLPLSHGTGLLTDSAWNAIPELDSDIQSWLIAFNYPFDAAANRTSTTGIVIPVGLFREFDIAVPAGDQPTGDNTGTFYPVWISRIEKIGTGSGQLRFFFATYNVTDADTEGAPSTTLVEFASLDLSETMVDGEIVEITPIDDLQLQPGTSLEFQQHFGRGHVVLSSLWDRTGTDITDFFDAFDTIINNPADTEFSQAATRLSSFGLSRVPKYVPTVGQSRALLGSTSRRTTPVPPSFDNRYVTEQDQGTGNQVDLEKQTGIIPNAAIDRYGYTGGLAHVIVKLVLDADLLGSDPLFYDNQILPRLRILFGRDPQFGDFWYNGTRLMFFNGDTWQG
jgi:hypothetical protein